MFSSRFHNPCNLQPHNGERRRHSISCSSHVRYVWFISYTVNKIVVVVVVSLCYISQFVLSKNKKRQFYFLGICIQQKIDISLVCGTRMTADCNNSQFSLSLTGRDGADLLGNIQPTTMGSLPNPITPETYEQSQPYLSVLLV